MMVIVTLGISAVTTAILLSWAGGGVTCLAQLIQPAVARETAWCVGDKVLMIVWAGVCVTCLVQLIRAAVTRKPAWCVGDEVLMIVGMSLMFILCLLAYMPDDFLTRLGGPDLLIRPEWEYGPERRAFGFWGMLFSGVIGVCGAIDGLLCLLRK